MIAIVDYGVGNLFSLQSSFQKIGQDTVVTSDKKVIQNADKLILPGVGAFADAIKKLNDSGLVDTLDNERKKGKYLMGVCLGMQMLFEKSFEYGEHVGLGYLKGNVVPMQNTIDKGLKIPQIGWNELHIQKPHFLLKYCKEGDFVYFVHSYYATDCEDSLIATTDYGKEMTAAVAKDNIMGCQFHPEKSGEVGLKILQAFCEQKD